MNDDTTTPTPRTDADERMAWNAEYMVPPETARELERELTAMTEQRDEARRLAEKYRYLSCDSLDEADETLLPWETTNPNEL
jgi:hypothetical protein